MLLPLISRACWTGINGLTQLRGLVMRLLHIYGLMLQYYLLTISRAYWTGINGLT